MAETDWWTVTTIIAMTVITVITRAFFFLSSKPWILPGWVQRGLQYAPIAALAAVIIPEIVMSQGHLIGTFKDARLYAVAAGAAWFYLRQGVLGTIIAGMAVYLPLHLYWGW
ncbi:MAG: AzlD domain-containing protein [Chitinophagaceae bacterium]|nr:AzlD domain-containing protein [Polaromonas sp.]